MNPMNSDALLRALGWTLAHSLWQGAAVMLLLMALLPRVRAAVQRYRLAYAALVALFLAALLTFWRVYEPAGLPNAVAPVISIPTGQSFVQPDDAALIAENASIPAFWQDLNTTLERHYSLIAGIWALGFGFFLLRLGFGLIYLGRMRKSSRLPQDPDWQLFLNDLSERLAFSRPVRLLESALVHTPVALGFIKPVILMPIGMINRLSVQEVEAILAHEMAHIARHDWLLNLFQAFLETLFYHHPAVWWISAIIRKEREHCCDDAAVQLTGNRLAYAKALVQVQEMARATLVPIPALGMSGNPNFSGRRPMLLNRVRRVLNQPQPKSQIMEKFIATGVLLTLLTFFGLRNQAPQVFANTVQKLEAVQAGLFGEQPDAAAPQTDTLPKPKRVQKISRDDGDRKVEMEINDGRITRLNVDGKEIPAEQYDQYSDLTDDLLNVTPPPPPMPPDAPGLEDFPPPPAPPAPPAPLSPRSRVTTEKDAEGNTVIHIERQGKPTEIKVKDGLVYIDGKELKAGEAFDLKGDPQMFFAPDFNFAVPDMNFDHIAPNIAIPDIRVPNFEMPPLPDISPEHFNAADMENFRRDLERSKREYEREMRAWKAEQKHWTKEQKREFERMQKEMHEAQSTAQLMDLRRLQQDAQRQERAALRQLEATRRQMTLDKLRSERLEPLRSKQEAVSQLITENLVHDGLISDPNRFDLHLDSKEMFVNGEKQSKQIQRKYKELFEGMSGNKLKGGNEFNINKN